MEVEWLWPHQHLGQQQGPQVQVQGGKVVKVLPQSLLLLQSAPVTCPLPLLQGRPHGHKTDGALETQQSLHYQPVQ